MQQQREVSTFVRWEASDDRTNESTKERLSKKTILCIYGKKRRKEEELIGIVKEGKNE